MRLIRFDIRIDQILLALITQILIKSEGHADIEQVVKDDKVKRIFGLIFDVQQLMELILLPQ